MIAQSNPQRNVFACVTALDLTARQTDLVLPRLIDLLNENKPRVAQVLMGTHEGPWTQKDLRALEALILARTADAREACDFLRVARKACAYWAMRESSSAALPRIPVVLAPPLHPLRGNVARELARFRVWQQWLHVWLRQNSRLSQSQAKDTLANPPIEALVVSAVLHGGLHSLPSVLAMVRAIPEADERTQWVDGRIYIELDISRQGRSGIQLRRWQPDPLTAVLWARIKANSIEDILPADRPEATAVPLEDRELIRRVQARLRAGRAREPQSGRVSRGGIVALLQAARTAAAIEIPSILAAYASHRFVSHSVCQKAWNRMTHSDAPKVQQLSRKIAGKLSMHPSANRHTRTINPIDVPPEEVDPPWLQQLRAVLQVETRAALRTRLQQFKESSEFPLTQRMADFSMSLLMVRSASGKMRSQCVVRVLATDVARSLAVFLGTSDPAELDSEVLETLYGQCIESLGPRTDRPDSNDHSTTRSRRRQRLAIALREFHRYLVARAAKQPLEPSSEFASCNDSPAVDANPITLEEFHRALALTTHVWPRIEHRSRQRIARLLLILGFRCGLRRREALELRIEDLIHGAGAEIWIRPNAMRRLKSRNAIRRIPIHALLDAAELEELLHWREEQLNQIAPETEGFLFPNPDNHHEPVTQRILEEVNSILQQATGDPEMHYHQLRHSFASWTWLRLMLADMGLPPDLFASLPQTRAWLQTSTHLRDSLYSHSGPTRKHAYLVAQLLGHGHPATSMEHYIHFADLMLTTYLAQSPTLKPSEESILLASQRPRSTVQRWIGKGPYAVAQMLWQKQRSQDSANPVCQLTSSISESEANWVEQIIQLLTADDTSRAAMELPLLDSCNTSIQDVLERARYLASIPSGGRVPRHRMESRGTTLQWKAADPLQQGTLLCPLLPTHRADWRIVASLQPSIATLSRQCPQLLRSALDAYIHHVWRTRNIVVWHHPSDAEQTRNYFALLLRIGLKRADIRWISFDCGPRSRSLAQWKRALQLTHHDNIIKERSPNFEAQSAESWLGIEVLLHNFSDCSRHPCAGTYGLRFLMLASFLAFGQLPDQTSNGSSSLT